MSQKPFVAPYPAQGGQVSLPAFIYLCVIHLPALQPTPGSLRRVSSAPRPRSPPPVVANTIPACSVRPPSFDMGPNPYTERLVPIPIMEPVGRVTAPSWVRCAFIFDAVKDRYGEGVVIGTSMQDCLAGEGMQNGLDNLFRGSDFPHEDITMIIYVRPVQFVSFCTNRCGLCRDHKIFTICRFQWPGYEHFRYRCKIPLKADGQHITRRGLGYHIAVAYRNFFQV